MGFISNSIRVLKLARKPTKDEFIMVAKVTGLGIVIIGFLGTILMIIGNFFHLGG